MYATKWGMKLVLAAIVMFGVLACDAGELVALVSPSPTPTRTPRPTFTPIPTATNTPLPTKTNTPVPTPTRSRTPTRRPATRVPTKPPTAVPPPPAPPQPTVSSMEFHVNPPTCTHSGMTYIKGTVYLDRNDPNNRYQGAIVVLGPPDGSTIYGDPVKTDGMGEYTFVLSEPGQARPGTWAVWLVTPSLVRKSDIGGPITTNNLGPENPAACWAGSVDFWR